MIIVLTMHRSGSSLLASMLDEAGFSAGEKSSLIPGDKHNEKGYFERQDIVDFNESLLNYGCFSSSFPDPHQEIQLTDEKVAELKELLNKLADEKVEMIKDPRLCLTLPVWLPYIPDARIIFLYRDPLDVAESFVRRQRYPFTGALSLWEFYNHSALNNVRECKVAFISFDELVREQELSLERVLSQLNLPTNNLNADVSKKLDRTLIHGAVAERANELLSKSQRQLMERLSNADIYPEQTDLSESCSLNLELLQDFVELGYQPPTGRMVDRRSKEELEGIVSRNQLFKKNNAKLRTQLALTNDKLISRKQELSASQQEISNLTSQKNSLSKEKQQLKERNTHLLGTIKMVKELYRQWWMSPLMFIHRVLSRIFPNRHTFQLLSRLQDRLHDDKSSR